jgi:Helix-turn-helix domain
MSKENAVLSVDFRKEYSTAEDGVINTARVCISMESIHAGLIKEVGANRFAILLAIVSYMDENGQCFPSQEKIAELTGLGRATVQRNLQELIEVEFNGQKLLHKELIGNKKKKTVYTITAGAITNTDVTDETAKAMNSRDFVFYFADKYKETFGQGHTPNYSKEGAIFKRLLKSYDEETLKDIIDTVFRLYKEKWYKPQYPAPTVYQLGSWLADEAYKIVKAEKEQAQQLEERKQKALELDQTDKALEYFDKLL